MRVSAIVPVRNESAHLRATLQGLIAQQFPMRDFEIIVIDGQSEDGTADIVRDLQLTVPNLRLLHNPLRLASAARNIGIEQASGDFIVIVDGHCQIRDPHYLSRLVTAFERSGADMLGRPQPLRAERPSALQRAIAAARTSWLGHNPDSDIYSDQAKFVAPDNVAVAYRREVFERIGYFDETFDACEDVELNTRARLAGLTCYFTPAITVEYQPRGTIRGLAYQMARYGRGRARLARKHPKTMTPPSLVPPLWLLWLVGGVIASLASPVFGIAFAATLALYFCVVVAESIRVWRVQSQVSFARLPLVFAAIHLAFGWGYLRESVAAIPRFPVGLARRLTVRRMAITTR